VTFPATRVSLLAGIASDRASERHRALERVVQAYWKPVYKYARLKWKRSHEDAKDLTQGFFAAASEKEYLAAFDAEKGRFRTFLRVCVDRYVAKTASAKMAVKRGGAALALDFESAEHELAGAGGIEDVERWFEREWARSIFDGAILELRSRAEASGIGPHGPPRGVPLAKTRIAVFERYDLVDPAQRPSYAELARELGIKPTDVTNHLAAVRRELRMLVLETLRELTASDEEYRSEARALLGVDAT
jgi:DNA-directed RNA polymerase specialized sigma24 family protein